MAEDAKTLKAVEKELAENEKTAKMTFEHLHFSAVAGAVFIDGEFESEEMRDIVLEVIRGVNDVRMARNRTQINPDARGGGWKQPHLHEGTKS
jgi:hypothetical protein